MDLQSLLGLINNKTDAKSLVNVLLSQNPKVKPIFEQMKSSGKSEKEFVLEYAKQNNINIEPIVSALRGKGINL